MKCAFVIAVLFISSGMLQAEDVVKANFIPWGWPVAVRKMASNEAKKAAKELAETLGQKGAWEVESNPVCSLYVDIGASDPNPHEDYYLILIQGGGGSIHATDAAQFQLAVEALKSVVRFKDKVPQLPIGIMTNLPITKTP